MSQNQDQPNSPDQPNDDAHQPQDSPSSPRHPKLPPNAPVDHGFITEDFPCHQCAYNLRTTHIESTCPECGYNILKSIVLGANYYNHIPWLKSVSTGLLLMIIAVGISVGLFLLSFIPSLLIQFSTYSSNAISALDAIGCLSLPAMLAVYILALTGIIFYTTKKKSTPPDIADLTSRRYLRFTYIFWSVATIIAPFVFICVGIIISILITAFTGYIQADPTSPIGLILSITTTALIFLYIFAVALLPCIILMLFLRFTSHIADYFNRPAIYKLCRILYYTTLVAFSLVILAILTSLSSLAFAYLTNTEYFMNSIFSIDSPYIAFAGILSFFAIIILQLYLAALFLIIIFIIIFLRKSIKARINTNAITT